MVNHATDRRTRMKPAFVHHFALYVHPEQPDRPWFASLENDLDEHLEFSSPLELARFLANLSAEFHDETHTPPGLR